MNTTDTPFRPPVLQLLEQLHREFAGVKEGDVATYIPELAKADPDWFGICLVTATGTVYEVGDTRQPFTIQSISKPFVYGMALEDNGRTDVLKKVGVEPTGDVFNSISLEPGTGRPRNPMINAGAIATTGLIAGMSLEGRLKRILATFGAYAARDLSLDENVYRSESETGHRNRAIGHMLRNFDILTTDPVPVVELYFKQCSISVHCRDLGMMAATLANRGVNPVTGRQAIRAEYVESVLSVMESCGTYDFAGEWIYSVGLPAKSGVAGGIIAVLPGQLGIGVFSPPLDERGNSVRGIRACEELSRSLSLHQLNRATMGRVTIRTKLTAADFNSTRVRPPAEAGVLREHGRRIQCYQLQGHLAFSTTETVVASIMESVDQIEHLILDFRRVVAINECACGLLLITLEGILRARKSLAFVQTEHLPLLRRYFKAKLGTAFEEKFIGFDDLDPALEWAEDLLIAGLLPPAPPETGSTTPAYELFAGLSPGQLALIAELLERRAYRKGESIIRAGTEANELYLLARGSAHVVVSLPSGARRRLATFTAGMAFGEMAAIDRAPRSADIIAQTDAECDLLKLEDLESLGRTHPEIRIKLLQNLSLGLSAKLRKANREITMLE